MGLRSSILINDSLCAYYIKLWAKCKKLWDNKFIHRFWVSYGLIKIKVSESSQIIGHKCIQIQESKIHLLFSSIAIFCFIILFLSKKIQNLTCLYRSIFLLTILYSSLAVQVKNMSERWYWNQSRSCAKKYFFLSVIRILIILLLMFMPKCHCQKPILQPTNWISFVYRKLILTLAYNRLMKI